MGACAAGARPPPLLPHTARLCDPSHTRTRTRISRVPNSESKSFLKERPIVFFAGDDQQENGRARPTHRARGQVRVCVWYERARCARRGEDGARVGRSHRPVRPKKKSREKSVSENAHSNFRGRGVEVCDHPVVLVWRSVPPPPSPSQHPTNNGRRRRPRAAATRCVCGRRPGGRAQPAAVRRAVAGKRRVVCVLRSVPAFGVAAVGGAPLLTHAFGRSPPSLPPGRHRRPAQRARKRTPC